MAMNPPLVVQSECLLAAHRNGIDYNIDGVRTMVFVERTGNHLNLVSAVTLFPEGWKVVSFDASEVLIPNLPLQWRARIRKNRDLNPERCVIRVDPKFPQDFRY